MAARVVKSRTGRALWRCPRCGRAFANRNQSHFCAPLTPLKEHFRNATPKARQLYRVFLAAIRKHGPVRIVSNKTRIGFQARMTFADLQVRKNYLRGYLILPRPVRDPRFLQVLSVSPRNHIHYFRLERPADLDPASTASSPKPIRSAAKSTSADPEYPPSRMSF